MQQLPEPISVFRIFVKAVTSVTINWVSWLMAEDEDSRLFGSVQISCQPVIQRIIDVATMFAVLIQDDEVGIIVIEGEGGTEVTASWTPINNKRQRLIMTLNSALLATVVIAHNRNPNHIVSKRSLQPAEVGVCRVKVSGRNMKRPLVPNEVFDLIENGAEAAEVIAIIRGAGESEFLGPYR